MRLINGDCVEYLIVINNEQTMCFIFLFILKLKRIVTVMFNKN